MKTLFKTIWQKICSIHLTVALCLMITADSAWGYFCLNRHADLFEPLNDIGLVEWIATFGRHNLSHTLWLMLLLVLLFLLGLNTFACTTDRVLGLVSARSRMGARRFFFRLAPHVMHYAVLIILSGYLGTYLFARVLDSRTLVPGGSMTLPGTAATITFDAFDPIYYEGDALPAFENRVLMPRARLTLTRGDDVSTAVLAYNRPVRFEGYGIFLKNFNPTMRSGGMSGRTRIDLSLRRDPGVRLYIPGMFLFTVGLVMYLVERVFYKKNKKETL